MSEIEQSILGYLAEISEGQATGVALTRDTGLLETGFLDSINLVRLIQFLEERFKIQIPDADLGPELFASAATISAYVAQRAG